MAERSNDGWRLRGGEKKNGIGGAETEAAKGETKGGAALWI